MGVRTGYVLIGYNRKGHAVTRQTVWSPEARNIVRKRWQDQGLTVKVYTMDHVS